MEIEIVEPGIGLITYTPSAEQHIEMCGREAYGSASSSTLEDTRAWIRKRIKGGEEDVVEHAVATWYIVCSRVVSHELVRHRLASYTQMSQRFTEKATSRFIIPEEIVGDERDWWKEEMEAAYNDYKEQREKYPRQIARYLLPNATATSLYATWNFRVMRHIIKMRADSSAQPEFRRLAERMKETCIGLWPGVFGDLEPTTDKED